MPHSPGFFMIVRYIVCGFMVYYSIVIPIFMTSLITSGSAELGAKYRI